MNKAVNDSAAARKVLGVKADLAGPHSEGSSPALSAAFDSFMLKTLEQDYTPEELALANKMVKLGNLTSRL